MKKVILCLALVAAIALPCFAGWYTCKRCNGTGVVGTKNCSRCNGSREIVVTCKTCGGQKEIRDQYGELQKCPSCNGWGKEYATCPKCNGSGEEDWICPVCHGDRQVFIEE